MAHCTSHQPRVASDTTCDKLGAPSLLTANSASAPGCRLVSAKVCGTNLHPTLLWVHVPAELGTLPLPTSTSRRHDGSLEKGSLPLPWGVVDLGGKS